MKDKGTLLCDLDIHFFRGITTGLNEAFHITEDVKNNLVQADPKNKEIIKPLLRGKDIKRWIYQWANNYLIFNYHGFYINKYPAIENHLKKFKTRLIPKDNSSIKVGRKPGHYHWYEIQDNSAYYPYFEEPKIIWIEISDKANYTYDDTGMYLTNSAYFLTSSTVKLKYLLAILNAKLTDFYFFQVTAKIAGGRKRYTKQYVQQNLIPPATKDQEEVIIRTVDEILSEKKQVKMFLF